MKEARPEESTFQNSWRCRLIYTTNRKQISGCLIIRERSGQGQKRVIIKGPRETFGGDGYVFCLYYCGGLTDIYLYIHFALSVCTYTISLSPLLPPSLSISVYMSEFIELHTLSSSLYAKKCILNHVIKNLKHYKK